MRLTTRADPDSVDLVHDLLDKFWTEEPEVAGRDRARVTGAAAEIVGNIVQHGTAHPGRDGITMDVDVTRSDGAVGIRIVDDAQPVSLPADTAMPDWSTEHGRGLALARALTDEFRWERLPSGNRWTLICRLGG
jgi:serine/threonine-protein kinase RsbW